MFSGAGDASAPRVRAAKGGAKAAARQLRLETFLLRGPNHGPATKVENRSEVGRSFTRGSES